MRRRCYIAPERFYGAMYAAKDSTTPGSPGSPAGGGRWDLMMTVRFTTTRNGDLAAAGGTSSSDDIDPLHIDAKRSPGGGRISPLHNDA